MSDHQPPFADDLLQGAKEIAEFMFGDPKEYRRIFYLNSKTRFPTFKIGAAICARRSTLMEWIRRQEKPS